MTKAIPDPEALRLGPRFVPHLGFRPRGLSGDHLGPGVGASLEFEDRRHYAPGDDLRHIDWRVMARTNDVLVRVHREEIQPRLDLMVDGSRSMATEPEKAQATADLAGLFCASAQAAGLALRIFVLGDQLVPLSVPELMRHGLHFASRSPLSDGLMRARARLTPGSLRIVLSDFLEEGALGLAPLTQQAGGVALIQVFGPWEADPQPGERVRLIDSESGQMRDLTLDRGLVQQYQQRLTSLGESLEGEARRLGMRFAPIRAGGTLEAMVRDALLPADVLRAAAQ